MARRGDGRGWEGPGSGSSESSVSIKLVREIGGVGTLKDCAGTAEGGKVTLGDGDRSSGSITLGRKIGVASTLRDGDGTAEGGKVTLGDGGAATGITCGARSGAGGGRTMAWSKMLSRYSMARSWELPSLSKWAAGVGCERESARARATTMEALEEDILGIGQDAGGNCTVLAMRSAQVAGMYTQ